MRAIYKEISIVIVFLFAVSCQLTAYAQQNTIELPKPYQTKSVNNFSSVLGWTEGKTPLAPKGFVIEKFAGNFQNPRWIYIAPNNDIFISEAGTLPPENMNEAKEKSQNFGSANLITMFRDTNKDGKYESRYTYINRLRQPFGMLIINDSFYVANTDGLVRFPYNEKDTVIRGHGDKILDLPAGGYNNHWTRNIISNPEKTKIYISVGSASNNAEHGIEEEHLRANIIEINPDGSDMQVYASGLRNPVGMDWEPVTHHLWTAVNERDGLGDDLVPDYATHVQRGGFYGWPYTYFGTHEDPRMKGRRPDLTAQTIIPDVSLGAHTASLGLVFYKKELFPAKYS